jgi:hypothetical protein
MANMYLDYALWEKFTVSSSSELEMKSFSSLTSVKLASEEKVFVISTSVYVGAWLFSRTLIAIRSSDFRRIRRLNLLRSKETKTCHFEQLSCT